jgi:peptide-methionine (R)-S-oxide reductase
MRKFSTYQKINLKMNEQMYLQRSNGKSSYRFLGLLSIIFIVATIVSCKAQKSDPMADKNQESDVQKEGNAASSNDKNYVIDNIGDTIKLIEKSEDEWAKQLTKEEFYVLRKKGTERSFTGDLLENKQEGLYTCAGCGLSIFRSNEKFESGTGWPSFWKPADDNLIRKATDYDLGYPRTEVMCARCGGHLGHVFNDGPKPTGLRYCLNSVSLNFVKAEN